MNFLNSYRDLQSISYGVNYSSPHLSKKKRGLFHLSCQIYVCRVVLQMFPCDAFDVCRICAAISIFIPNIGNLYLLSVLSVLLEIWQILFFPPKIQLSILLIFYN